jgi:nucleoside-diphosphate-sugar epimerase
MKTLVFGGSKFVGLHLVYELIRQGHEVTVLNRGKTKVEFPSKVKRLYGDRFDVRQIRSVLKGGDFEAIFDNSFGLFGTPFNPQAYEEEIRLFGDLFGKTLKHLVFTSTQFIYRKTDFYPFTEESPVDRDIDAKIAGGEGMRNYLLNKMKCEDELQRAYKADGFPITIIRPTWVYGPENYRYSREMSYFVRLEEGRKIIVPNYGLELYQCGHVDDLARAFVSALGNKRSIGQIYNITGEDIFTINGFISTAGKVVGVEPKVVYIDYKILAQLEKAASTFQMFNGRSCFCSIDKAKNQLDWKPQHDLESGLRDTYQWFQKVGRGWYDEYGSEWAGGGKSFDFSHEDEVLARYSL